MTAKNVLTVITLGACLLGLSGLGSQKNPLERPFKVSGQGTAVFTLGPDGTILGAETSGKGNFTHLSLVTLRGEGKVNEFGILVIEVIMTARMETNWSGRQSIQLLSLSPAARDGSWARRAVPQRTLKW